jgi:ComF family protein
MNNELQTTNLLSPLVHLFYPDLCEGCGSDLVQRHNLLCLTCINHLPHTSFENHEDNPVEKIFWGRLNLEAAMSQFYFAKGSIIQKLVHEFKYNGNKDIGTYLGKMIGETLLNSSRFKNIDVIIPLPLFASKEYRRGFNQSAILCDGISSVMNIPVDKNNVTRKHYTDTQTKKHRTERWENVMNSFQLNLPGLLNDKHILLVDDVITTGATLEACGSVILEANKTKLSIATLAFATK